MKKMFYCSEADDYLTIDDIKKEYIEFKTENGYTESFPYYLESCMYYNNGTLQTIQERENNLKRSIAKLSIDKYSIDELLILSNDLYRLYQFEIENE